ncbi:hypothetical protein CPB86DRAFT_309050 [Serendipita vermifera]|nr:hypothetical protein CPB86DRAFT_309050 [Serendipita vermifera]
MTPPGYTQHSTSETVKSFQPILGSLYKVEVEFTVSPAWTNRQLHALCTPLLRQDLNILNENLDHGKFALEQASKYSQHIRTIRFFLKARLSVNPEERFIHEKCILDIVSLCTQVTSMYIYDSGRGISFKAGPQTLDFSEQILNILLTEGRTPLKSLGIYSVGLLRSAIFLTLSLSIASLFQRIPRRRWASFPKFFPTEQIRGKHTCIEFTAAAAQLQYSFFGRVAH